MSNKLFVITGGPGVGKTTLLHELKKVGFPVVEEDARKIIQQQIQANGEALPWKNKVLYAKLMLEASVNSYEIEKQKQHLGTVFFDRGILDTICYMNMENIPISAAVNEIALSHPYAPQVFILPPWEQIYKTDSERKQTWEEAVSTFQYMKKTYLSYGYQVIELPKTDVKTRREFIEKEISQL